MIRTTLALASLLVAFSLIGASWWVTSRSELDGRIERTRARAEDVARHEAERLAVRFARRLEGPRDEKQQIGRASAQGFPGELGRPISGAGLPAHLAVGSPLRSGYVRAPISQSGWWVEVDARAPRAEAESLARAMTSRFRTGAIAFATVALLVCVLVVFVVLQAEQVARERSLFAASAAHELRTPLAGIRLYAEMLAEGLGDPAGQAEYARRLASEAARLGRVVSNVLGFSRLERGHLVVRPEPGDLAGIVRECVLEVEPGVTAAGALVELAIVEPLPPVLP